MCLPTDCEDDDGVSARGAIKEVMMDVRSPPPPPLLVLAIIARSRLASLVIVGRYINLLTEEAMTCGQ